MSQKLNNKYFTFKITFKIVLLTTFTTSAARTDADLVVVVVPGSNCTLSVGGYFIVTNQIPIASATPLT